jgi:hypothetical protein
MPIRISGATSGYTELAAAAAAGNNTISFPAGNGTNGQVLSGNGAGALSWSNSVGAGQTWTNVTASRAFGTTYTNSTGAPITVVIAFAYPTAGAAGVLTVGGVAIQFGQVNSAYIQLASGTAIVPAGATYVFTASTTLNQWLELR